MKLWRKSDHGYEWPWVVHQHGARGSMGMSDHSRCHSPEPMLVRGDASISPAATASAEGPTPSPTPDSCCDPTPPTLTRGEAAPLDRDLCAITAEAVSVGGTPDVGAPNAVGDVWLLLPPPCAPAAEKALAVVPGTVPLPPSMAGPPQLTRLGPAVAAPDPEPDVALSPAERCREARQQEYWHEQ
jgi:hypothetical protein